MTKPWRVDVLECRGSSYDVGKQMAEGFLKTPRGRAYGAPHASAGPSPSASGTPRLRFRA